MILLDGCLDIDASPIKQQTGTRATRRRLRLVNSAYAAVDCWSSATRRHGNKTSQAHR